VRVLAGFVQRWVVLAAAVALWQLVTAATDDPFFPTPWQIAQQCRTLWFTTAHGRLGPGETVFDDVLPSLGRVLAGWALAGGLGVSIGTALGRSRTGMHYAGPVLAFLRTLPSPALLPVFVVLFGLTTRMGVALIAFGSIWPILLNTADGVRSVDPVKTDTARSFRIPRTQWITRVVLPAALPKIFAGLRVSLPIAVILMVISEMVGVTNGIGYQLTYAKSRYEIPTLWAWIVGLGVIGYGLNLTLVAVQRRALRWQPARAGRLIR
jgi:ABC-type nitrate/sulfonate/bicarbonate transport system permease component